MLALFQHNSKIVDRDVKPQNEQTYETQTISLLTLYDSWFVPFQAALLLVNLTSVNLPTGPVQEDPNAWQGPVVMDAEYKV